MKKILILGGTKEGASLINKIHNLGHVAATTSNSLDEPIHRYADECYEVSVLDKEGVLKLAEDIGADAVESFSDLGVCTAAYVSEQLGLPFQCSYKAAQILQNKGLFKKFLIENGLNSPHAKSYKVSEVSDEDYEYFNWPVIVKPVDSAGSNGITKVEEKSDLKKAMDYAISKSISGECIIEDFLEFQGCHLTGDWFVLNGELKYSVFIDHVYDENTANKFLPIMNIFPSSISRDNYEALKKQFQKLIDLLNIKSGIFNLDACIGSDGLPYIMEFTPRMGGGLISEFQHLASGIDLIDAYVKVKCKESVGEFPIPATDKFWVTYKIHETRGKTGTFKEVIFDTEIKEKYIKSVRLKVSKGDFVGELLTFQNFLGYVILCFDTKEELECVMSRAHDWIDIQLEN